MSSHTQDALDRMRQEHRRDECDGPPDCPLCMDEANQRRHPGTTDLWAYIDAERLRLERIAEIAAELDRELLPDRLEALMTEIAFAVRTPLGQCVHLATRNARATICGMAFQHDYDTVKAVAGALGASAAFDHRLMVCSRCDAALHAAGVRAEGAAAVERAGTILG